jgi:HK97 family phage major capsid protein
MDTSTFESLMKEMSELTAAVKGAQNPKTDLQWETVEKEFGEKINQLVDSRVQEKLDAAPAYRRIGDPVSQEYESEVGTKNVYRPYLKSLAKDGFYRAGNRKGSSLDMWLAHSMLQKAHSLMPDRVKPPSADLAEAVKALTSTGSATGDELVPTNLASQLWDDIFLASRIAGTITTIEMPTNPFDVPLGLGAVTWRKGTENTATTASDPATAKVTLTATELITEQNWSYTLEEDAVVAIMPAVRGRLAQSGAEIVDDFFLNADATNAGTGNINLDDADPDDTSYYLTAGQDGIRHQWIVDNTGMNNDAGGDALTDADITGALADMGKYAVDPMSVVMVCDVSTYLNGFLKTGSTAPGEYVSTIDKFGQGAIILTGQLAAYRGIPIIVSASHRKAEADGKLSTTGGNNTLGSITVYNRSMWVSGFRRQVLVETDRDIQKRMWIMVTSLRPAIGAWGTRSTNTHTAGIRNILV